MAWGLVSSVSAAPGISGGTSAAIDTTGADLLVVRVSRYVFGSGLAVADNYGNTFTPLTEYGASDPAVRFWYAAGPVVGPGHTFSVTGSGIYPSFDATAWSGATPAAPFESESGASAASATSIRPGSVTPAEAGALVLFGLGWDSGPAAQPAVDSGFTVDHFTAYASGVNLAGLTAYLVPATAAAVNPTCSWSGALPAAAAMAVFKPAAGPPPPPGVFARRTLGPRAGTRGVL